MTETESGFAKSQKAQKAQQASSNPTAFPGTSVAGVDSQWWNSQVAQDPPKGTKPADFGLFKINLPVASKTVGQLLLEFDNADPSATDQITVLQGALWNAGMYTGKKPTFAPGVKDAQTRTAFVRALELAVRNKETVGSVLDGLASSRSQAGIGGSGSTATHSNVIQHSAPTDVGAGALAGFQAALGRGPTPQERAAFLAAYRQQETASQPDTSGGGTFDVTSAGNASASAEQYAQQADPELASQYGKYTAFQMVLSSLGVKQ